MGYEAECSDTCSYDSTDDMTSGDSTPAVSPRFKLEKSTANILKRRADDEDQFGKILKRRIRFDQIASPSVDKVALQHPPILIVSESTKKNSKRSRVPCDDKFFVSSDDSTECKLSGGDIKKRQSDYDDDSEYQGSVYVSDSSDAPDTHFVTFRLHPLIQIYLAMMNLTIATLTF